MNSLQHSRPFLTVRHLCLLALAVAFLPSCSSERYHAFWRTLDPVGYKHSHSAVFNGSNYQRGIQPAVSPTASADEMGMEIAR